MHFGKFPCTLPQMNFSSSVDDLRRSYIKYSLILFRLFLGGVVRVILV